MTTRRRSGRPQARYSSDGRYLLGEEFARRDGLLYRWAAARGDVEGSLLIAIPMGESPGELSGRQGCERAAQRGRAYWERNLLWRQQDVRSIPLPVRMLEQYPLCRELRDACRQQGDTRTLHSCGHALVAVPGGVRLDRYLRHHALERWDALRLGIQLLAHVESLPEPWQSAPLSGRDFVAAGADQRRMTALDLVRFHLLANAPRTPASSGPVGAVRRLLMQLSSRWPQTFASDHGDGPLLTPAQARARYGHLPSGMIDALVALASAPAAMWPSLRDLGQLWRAPAGIHELVERPAVSEAQGAERAGEGDEGWSIATPRFVGSWRWEAPFAHGARGELYRAESPARVRALAKLNRYRYDSFREFREALDERQAELAHEARVLSELSSRSSQLPRFVSFEGVTRVDGWFSTSQGDSEAEHALYMERLPGLPLTRFVSAMRREPRALLWFMMELARALKVFHGAGYVFQDLKTENVIVDPISGHLSLVDVGSACPVGSRGELDSTSPAFGAQTRGFAAPEFDQNWRSVDFRFDLYSLGAVGYHLATGRDPEAEALRAEERGGGELAFAPLALLPRGLQRVIRTCLAPKSLRYQDVEELMEDIREALHDPGAYAHSRSSSSQDAAARAGSLKREEPARVRVLSGQDGALLSWSIEDGWTLEAVELYASAGEVPLWSWQVPERSARVVTLPPDEGEGRLAQLRFRHQNGEHRSMARLIETRAGAEPPPLHFVAEPEEGLESGEEPDHAMPLCGVVYAQSAATRVRVMVRLPEGLSDRLELRLWGDDGTDHREGFRLQGGQLCVAELNTLRADHLYHLAVSTLGVDGPAAVLAWTAFRALPQPLDVQPYVGPGCLTLRYHQPSCRLTSVMLLHEGAALRVQDGQRFELPGGRHCLTLIEGYDDGRLRRKQSIEVDVPPRDLRVDIDLYGSSHELGDDALHEVILEADVEVLPLEVKASLTPRLRPQQAAGIRLDFEFRRAEPDEDWAPLPPSETDSESRVHDGDEDDDTVAPPTMERSVQIAADGPFALGVPYLVRAVVTFADGSTRRSAELRVTPVERLPAPRLRPKLAALLVAPPRAGLGEVEVRVRRQRSPDVERVIPSRWPHEIALQPGETCFVSWRRRDLAVACPFSLETKARAQQRPELPQVVRAHVDDKSGVPSLSWSFAGTRHEEDAPEVRVFAQQEDGTLRLAYRGHLRSHFADTLWQGERNYVIDTLNEGLRSETTQRLALESDLSGSPGTRLRLTPSSRRDRAAQRLPVARLHRLSDQKSVLECVHSGQSGVLLVRQSATPAARGNEGVVVHTLARSDSHRDHEMDTPRWWSEGDLAVAPTTGFRTLIPLPERAASEGGIELHWSSARRPFRWQRVPIESSQARAVAFSIAPVSADDPGAADDGGASAPTGKLVSLRSRAMGEGSRLPTALKLDMLTFGHAGWLSDWEHLCVELEGHDLVMLEPARSAGVRQVLASVSDERVVLLPYAPDEASALALVERYRLTRVLPLAIELAVLESGGVIMRADERFPAPKSAFLHQGSPYSVTLKPSWRRDRFRFRRSLQLELCVLTPDGVNRSRLRVPQAGENSLLSWLVGAIAAKIRSSFIGGR